MLNNKKNKEILKWGNKGEYLTEFVVKFNCLVSYGGEIQYYIIRNLQRRVQKMKDKGKGEMNQRDKKNI